MVYVLNKLAVAPQRAPSLRSFQFLNSNDLHKLEAFFLSFDFDQRRAYFGLAFERSESDYRHTTYRLNPAYECEPHVVQARCCIDRSRCVGTGPKSPCCVGYRRRPGLVSRDAPDLRDVRKHSQAAKGNETEPCHFRQHFTSPHASSAPQYLRRLSSLAKTLQRSACFHFI